MSVKIKPRYVNKDARTTVGDDERFWKMLDWAMDGADKEPDTLAGMIAQSFAFVGKTLVLTSWVFVKSVGIVLKMTKGVFHMVSNKLKSVSKSRRKEAKPEEPASARVHVKLKEDAKHDIGMVERLRKKCSHDDDAETMTAIKDVIEGDSRTFRSQEAMDTRRVVLAQPPPFDEEDDEHDESDDESDDDSDDEHDSHRERPICPSVDFVVPQSAVSLSGVPQPDIEDVSVEGDAADDNELNFFDAAESANAVESADAAESAEQESVNVPAVPLQYPDKPALRDGGISDIPLSAVQPVIPAVEHAVQSVPSELSVPPKTVMPVVQFPPSMDFVPDELSISDAQPPSDKPVVRPNLSRPSAVRMVMNPLMKPVESRVRRDAPLTDREKMELMTEAFISIAEKVKNIEESLDDIYARLNAIQGVQPAKGRQQIYFVR